MKIAFKTYGCRANSTDTDALYLEARSNGFEIVEESESPDALVINSCTVTSQADKEARTHALQFKRKNPLSLVAVVGCYAQVAKDEVLALPEVDLVVGTANKFTVLETIKNAMNDGVWVRDNVQNPNGFLPETFRGSRNARATIKIQDGCNFSCSFCIIPTARGRSRSLSEEIVLKQIDEAYEAGFEEVILTGIHLAHYGWDINTNLISLLKKIFAKAKGPRVRLSTLDPFEVPDELIEMLGSEERLCPYFHIALQSGSDKILKAMKRIYLAEEFVEVTQKIKAQFSDTFIGVDIIVGFPGETSVEFKETIDCLNRSFWAKLHVFPFSVRKGTAAANLKEKVSLQEIHDRSQLLLKLGKENLELFLKTQIGKTRKVILERPVFEKPNHWLGHTENYLPTLTITEEGKPKQVVYHHMQALTDGKLLTGI